MIIINIIKKLQNEGFVRWDGTNLLDGEGNTIDSIEGLGGTENSSGQTLYIAYASSPSGAGFTLTPSTTLEYIAAKAFSTVPGVNDFNGLWFHRKGIPGSSTTGAPGADGLSAGFDITMNLASVTMDDPGGGKIRFNTTTLADAVEIYLNDESPTGVDMSGVYDLLTSGTQLLVRKKSSDTMAVFKLTADADDQVGWYKLTVQCTAVSSTTFVEGDKCTLQIFGGGFGSGTVTEQAVIDAGNFARLEDNGAGGYNLVDNTGNVIESASPVYRLPGSGIVGATDLPDANTFPHASVVRLHQDTLVGAGANPMGIMIQADATNNKWRPYGRQMLFFKTFGSYASPTCTLTASGKFNVGVDPIVPGGLLQDDSRLVFFVKYLRNSNVNNLLVFNAWFGTNTTTRASNSKVYTHTTAQTANLENIGRAELDFLTSTTARTSLKTPVGGVGAVNTNPDMSASLNIASPMVAMFDTTGHTTVGDTVMLFEIGIAWER